MGQGQGQDVDDFVVAVAGLGGVDAESGELDGLVAAAGADDDAAGGDHVEGGDFFGEAEGVVEGEDQDGGADLDAFGAFGDRGAHEQG